jgi:hypothetical protein
MPGVNMDLWSRISRNSGGSLPTKINELSRDEIRASDSESIKSYLTASRSIRKCCITLFAACAGSAANGIGCFKNCKKRPYSVKSISSSVKELSKPTSAGADTLGKKNDKKVQNHVIKQITDLFRKPTLRKVAGNAILKDFDDLSIGNKLYLLPEVVYHRFQSVFDEVEQISNVKSRIVWCVPYVIVALENMFFGPILNSVKEQMSGEDICIYPIGLRNNEIGQNCVGTLRDTYKNIGVKSGMKIFSLDFSKFDASVPQFVKDIFFAIFQHVIDLEDNIFKRIYCYLRVYIKYTPFVKDDSIKFKLKGISSGLYITNLFDTLWNLTLHIFTNVIECLYPELKYKLLVDEVTFDKLYIKKDDFKIKDIEQNSYIPYVRVMGDDSIILCREETIHLFKAICRILGMKVTIKHVCEHPESPIFFLGRYWDNNNLPFQTEGYIALHIVYTRWYDKKEIPFSLKELHLNRILSICLPLKNGKEFLDKYLFDYEPYVSFKGSNKGFTYMKDFIEETFQYIPKEKVFSVTSY